MEGSAKILSLIARDEATHLNLSTHVLKAWHKGDDPEMTKAIKGTEKIVIQMFKDCVEEEKAYKHSHDLPIALESLSDELQAWVKTGQDYYRNILGIKELDNTVAFLRGEYIPVTTGGDPLRHPDSLPTGYNLYGFDPARVPTKAAYEQGTELVEQIIMDYYNDNGRYPDKLAFSLWSIETMRQYGVLDCLLYTSDAADE